MRREGGTGGIKDANRGKDSRKRIEEVSLGSVSREGVEEACQGKESRKRD